MTGDYRVVVPLPPWAEALPRVDAPSDVRRTLARAFARDTLSAVQKVGRVHDLVVATADPLVAAEVSAWGVGTLDPSSVEQAGPTAVLRGTLPCLLPGELDQALRSARRERVEVLDLAGIHPTFQANPDGWPLGIEHPPGGTPLRAAWLAAQELLPGLSCDVATLDGLRVAAFIGVGRATALALAELDGVPGIRPRGTTTSRAGQPRDRRSA